MTSMQDNGNTFNELMKSSLLQDDDLMMVSIKTGNNEYESRAIDIASLARQLNKELDSSLLKLGSIAYHDQAEYATSDHDHDIFTSAVYSGYDVGNRTFDVLSVQHLHPS